MKTTAEIVTRIIAEQMCIDPGAITPDSRIVADLRADSLDSIGLVMAIEDEFGIEIPDDDAEKCITVADCIALADRLNAEQNPTAPAQEGAAK